jgi:bifunctional enzyme CysN/CysC
MSEVEPHQSALISPDVTWQASRIDRRRRWESLGTTGGAIWMTGLSASGKSTIAGAVEAALVAAGRAALLLDGDNLRHGLSGDLGFAPEDRTENVRRVAHAARLLAEAGAVAIVSLVSPYRADRKSAREIIGSDGIPFVEVFVSTPLAKCEERDPKGLYAKARSGEIADFTGISAPYEAPTQPDVELDASSVTLEAAVAAVLDAFSARTSGI